MFIDRFFDRSRHVFAEQFQPDGEAFLYRKNMRGAARKVTAGEREIFIREFDKGLRYLARFLLAGVPVTALCLMGFAGARGGYIDKGWIFTSVSIWTGICLSSWHFLWHVPERALAHRPRARNRSSHAKVRHLVVAKASWDQLASAGTSIMLVIARFAARPQLLTGWNRLMFFAAAGGLVALVGQVLKRFGRRRP
ncbi:hypothetical protein [Emcibacter sp. SYSU 3D8]|uniref:hypothetical protein n=1 Tax=Emcibacter sp. SYSU 3D8 TaxID=3133969 RepID=UPI0031FE8EC1